MAGQEVWHTAGQVPGCNTGKPTTKNLGQNKARYCRVEFCGRCVVGVRGLRLGVAAGRVHPSAAEVRNGARL